MADIYKIAESWMGVWVRTGPGVNYATKSVIYGKDKKGYFAVCIDQEDFDRMYNALQEIGYTRDIIIDAIMP